MKLNIRNTISAALLSLPLMAAAQAETAVDFAAGTGYSAISFYDTWPESPFRTGALKGNWAITGTEGLPSSEEYQTPARVLGAQRSRFGSNTFGVRIDLEKPFELTNTYKYVHVMMMRPVSGRVMLVGIGESRDFPENGDQVEQFWEISRTNVMPGKWCDALFAVKGFGNISVKSLVVVPECESPHASAEDFAFYVASVEVNDSPIATVNAENYPVNAGSRENGGSTLKRNDRFVRSVTLVSADGEQTVPVSQQADKLLYHQITDDCVSAKPGEQVTLRFDYNGTWMNGYVYLDRDNNGKFDDSLGDDGLPTASSEVMSFSHCGGKNSAGENVGANTLAMPAFTIPADLAPGVYRLRAKIDWDCIDAGGNRGDATGNNEIVANGGSITDIMLNVHTDEISVNDNQLNGEVLAADGSKLNALKAPFGQPFDIRMNPEKGFTHRGVIVRYGYLDGDSVVMENPQVFTRDFTFSGDEFTVPGECMRGNVMIMGKMVEQGSLPDEPVLGQPSEFVTTTIADGKFAASTQWYVITNGQDGARLYDQGEDEAILLPQNPADPTGADNELWCVVGSATEGYRLYNKGAGTARMLASPAEMTGTTGGTSYAILKAPGDTGYIYDWDITSSSAWTAPAYFIGQHGIAANKLNSRDGKLAFWTGGAGLGSSFHFIPVTLSGIDEVAADSGCAPRRSGIYDLAGRRITGTPAPGIYIIDGRKTLVR